MRRLALLTPLCVFLLACPPAVDTGPDGGARGPILAGPAGGLFVRECGAIDIPKDALKTDAEFQMAPVTAGIPQVARRTRIGVGCRITGPSGLTFEKPVTVSVPYDPAQIPAEGIDPADFHVFSQVGVDPAAAMDDARTDTLLKVVSGSTRRLGLFWPTSPNDPELGELIVEPPEVMLRVGDSVQLNARATGPEGEAVSEVPITWSVQPTRVGRVEASGRFTATAPGNARAVAHAGQLTKEVLLYVAGNTPGPFRFEHDTPFPTGNDLLGGMALADGAALAVGSNGTVLTRTAAGAWSRLFSAPFLVLRAVAVAADGSAVAAGARGTEGVMVTRPVGGGAATVRFYATSEPRAVWYDGSHGMAVGTGNAVLMLRNGTWEPEHSPTFETILGVTGDATGRFSIVGSQGSLYAYDPTTRLWDSLYQTQLSVLLTAGVVDASGSEAWALGAGRLWHYQGAQWTPIELPVTPVLEDLTSLGLLAGKVVVGGVTGRQGYLLTYDPQAGPSGAGPLASPASWSAHALRIPQVPRSIFAAGTDSGYAVGDLGAVWKWAGTTWVEESRGFYGNVSDVSVAPDGVVVAAVTDCANLACTQLVGQVWRRKSQGEWEQLMAGVTTPLAPVNAVLARSATEVYAGTDKGLMRWDGQTWTPALSGGSGVPIHDITLCGSELWAVGERGTTIRGSGTLRFVQVPTTENLFAVHCTSPQNVWIAGDQVLLENGMPRQPEDVPQAEWHAVYTPAPGEGFAFGAASFGVYWDTETLQVIERPAGLRPRAVHRMWGSSIDNLYGVGLITQPLAHGVAMRFDGAVWSLVDAGASRAVSAVDGRSNLDVWLGTPGGGVLRALTP